MKLSDEITHQAEEGELDPSYRVVDVNRLDGWASHVARLERVATVARELDYEWWVDEEDSPEELVDLHEALKELEE